MTEGQRDEALFLVLKGVELILLEQHFDYAAPKMVDDWLRRGQHLSAQIETGIAIGE